MKVTIQDNPRSVVVDGINYGDLMLVRLAGGLEIAIHQYHLPLELVQGSTFMEFVDGDEIHTALTIEMQVSDTVMWSVWAVNRSDVDAIAKLLSKYHDVRICGSARILGRYVDGEEVGTRRTLDVFYVDLSIEEITNASW